MKNYCILILLILIPTLAKSQASLQRSMNIGIQTSQQAMNVSRAVSMNNSNYSGAKTNSFWSYRVTRRYLEHKIEKKTNDLIELETKTKQIDTILKNKKEELITLTNDSEKNSDITVSKEIKKKRQEITQEEKELLKNKTKIKDISRKIQLYKVKSQNLIDENPELGKKFKEREEEEKLKREKEE